MNAALKNRLRQAVYVAVLVLLVVFFIRQGSEPWLAAFQYWKVIVGMVALTPVTLAVQAVTFRYCIPSQFKVPSLYRLVHIWAIASISSIIAPFVAGLAVRVTLLKQEGVDVQVSSVATLRQVWINIEYAWLTGSVILTFYPWGNYLFIGPLGIVIWGGYKLVSRIDYLAFLSFGDRVDSWIKRISGGAGNHKLTKLAKIWFLGQIVIMSLNYSVAFWLGDAALIWHHCLLLTSVTILASVLIFIPHGLGILDSLWVWVAGQQGLTLTQGVALAITMRMGMFIGYGLVFIVGLLVSYLFDREP